MLSCLPLRPELITIRGRTFRRKQRLGEGVACSPTWFVDFGRPVRISDRRCRWVLFRLACQGGGDQEELRAKEDHLRGPRAPEIGA
jgi:hypothetical protein